MDKKWSRFRSEKRLNGVLTRHHQWIANSKINWKSIWILDDSPPKIAKSRFQVVEARPFDLSHSNQCLLLYKIPSVYWVYWRQKPGLLTLLIDLDFGREGLGLGLFYSKRVRVILAVLCLRRTFADPTKAQIPFDPFFEIFFCKNSFRPPFYVSTTCSTYGRDLILWISHCGCDLFFCKRAFWREKLLPSQSLQRQDGWTFFNQIWMVDVSMDALWYDMIRSPKALAVFVKNEKNAFVPSRDLRSALPGPWQDRC